MIDLIKRYLIYLPVFYLLFLYLFFPGQDFFLPGLTSEFIFTATVVVCLIVAGIKKKFLHFNRLDFIFLSFLIWYTIITQTKGAGVNKWAVIQSVTCVLTYFYFRNIKLNKSFFLFLFLAGIFQAVWGILQKNGILPSNHYLLDITGGFFNPAILGIFLVLAFLAGLMQWKPQSLPVVKCFFVLAYLTLLSCIILINSRAAWLALLTGFLWLFLTGTKRKKFFITSKPVLKYTLIFTITGILIYFTMIGLYYIRPDSVQGRFLIWQVIGSYLSLSPWTGQGPLQALYMPMQAAWFETHPDSLWVKFAGNNLYAFNEFLRITFESGIIGLILFGGLLMTGIHTALTGNKYSRYAGSLFLAVISFGLFSYPLSVPLILIVSTITLAVISQNSLTTSRISLNKSRWICLFFLGLFLLFTIQEYTYAKKADLLLRTSRHSPAVLTSEPMLHCYKQLRNNSDFILCYGKNLYEQGFYENARNVLEQGYRLKPSSELTSDLGKCYQQAKMFTEAEQAYALSAQMTPAYIMPRYHLFCLYQETGQQEKARKQANIILTMPVKVVNTSVLRVRNQVRLFLKNQSE